MSCLFFTHIPAQARNCSRIVVQHSTEFTSVAAVTPPLTSFYDIRYFRKGFHHTCLNSCMHEAYRCGLNARRMLRACPCVSGRRFHKCRRCICRIQSIGYHSQADACLLGTGDAFLCSHRRRWVARRRHGNISSRLAAAKAPLRTLAAAIVTSVNVVLGSSFDGLTAIQEATAPSSPYGRYSIRNRRWYVWRME